MFSKVLRGIVETSPEWGETWPGVGIVGART
jgi:hypothetical protein